MKNKWDKAGTLPSTHLERPVDCRMSIPDARRRQPLSSLAPIRVSGHWQISEFELELVEVSKVIMTLNFELELQLVDSFRVSGQTSQISEFEFDLLVIKLDIQIG